MHLIALLGLFQTEMTVFLTFLYASTSEISAGSRPWDKRGGGGGGGGLPKTFFGLHFGPKIRGGGAGARPLPWIRHWKSPPFHILEAWKGYSLWTELSRKGHSRKYPQPPKNSLCQSESYHQAKAKQQYFGCVDDVQVVSVLVA